MKKTLANYYRILRVPPDASQEAIKAGYRKLMVTFKMHPDLGGEHEVAAQINEAYQVLGNRAKRAAYDSLYFLAGLRAAQSAARAKDQRTDSGAQARPGATSAPKSAPNPPNSAADGCCPLCRTALPQSIGPETRCQHCRSPLFTAPQPGAYGRELFGRRASPRTAKTHFATVYPAGQPQSIRVKMRDLSLDGISFYSEVPLDAHQVFKIRDPILEALARVVSCRKRGQLYSVHARLLTVAFHHKAGVFVSTSG
jgi:curved DNA-binding protein CbpA